VNLVKGGEIIKKYEKNRKTKKEKARRLKNNKLI